jgi:hypothetical protein
MAKDARIDEQLARLQAQVDDLEALLAHHDEHGWEEPDEEAHVLRRLLGGPAGGAAAGGRAGVR